MGRFCHPALFKSVFGGPRQVDEGVGAPVAAEREQTEGTEWGRGLQSSHEWQHGSLRLHGDSDGEWTAPAAGDLAT